jgi:hypothetical protein
MGFDLRFSSFEREVGRNSAHTDTDAANYQFPLLFCDLPAFTDLTSLLSDHKQLLDTKEQISACTTGITIKTFRVNARSPQKTANA